MREIAFKANDQIEEGQVLVRIADEIEQADLAAAQAAVHLAQQSLDRVSSLGDRGFSSESTVQEAHAKLSSARAQVQRIQAQLDQKVLKAPFAGEIGIPDLEAGEYVTAGAVVATLQDVDMLRVDFALPEQNRPQIEIGQAVTVSTEAGSEATGFITAIEPRIDPSTRLTAIRAELDNREGMMSPGQFVRVGIALPTKKHVIALPQTAIVTSLYGDYAFVLVEAEGSEDSGLSVKQAFVDAGARIGGLVQITDGIEDGDRVVIAGQNRLSNGSPVTLSGQVAPAKEPATEVAPAETPGPLDDENSADGRPAAAQAAEAPE